MFTLQGQIGIQEQTLMTSVGDSQTMEAAEVLEDPTLVETDNFHLSLSPS